MAKAPIDNISFENLLDKVKQETSSNRKKFEVSYFTRGHFSGHQAATLLSCYKSAPDKMRIMEILAPRLCRMSCSEGKEILQAIPLTDNDRLIALDHIKRYLNDHHSTAGMEHILSSYEFERDKLRALGILQTVSSYVADQLASGGHEYYGAVGGLYSQNFPLNTHMHGSLDEQINKMAGQGNPAVARSAQLSKPPSFYRSHASNNYRSDVTYDEVRGYPGARGFPEDPMRTAIFPRSAPPTQSYYAQGAVASSGFCTLKGIGEEQ